jgi:CBS domain-containing protein
MQVSDVMTRHVETIPPDASLQQAAEAMQAMGVGSLPVCDGRRLVALQVRRLAVLDQAKNLVGIVSLGDIATEPRAANLREVGEAIAEISEPSRPHK